MSNDLKNKIACVPMGDNSMGDNLAIVLCTYFSDHLERPEDDPEYDTGWGEWVIAKSEEALDKIVAAIKEGE